MMCDKLYSILCVKSWRNASNKFASARFIARVFFAAFFLSAFCFKCLVFTFFKIKWWREYLCTRTFSVPKKQMFQIYLLRTHPQFSSTDRSPYFLQSLHYPRGRDYSATPTSLRRERKFNELLPRHQQMHR